MTPDFYNFLVQLKDKLKEDLEDLQKLVNKKSHDYIQVAALLKVLDSELDSMSKLEEQVTIDCIPTDEELERG